MTGVDKSLPLEAWTAPADAFWVATTRRRLRASSVISSRRVGREHERAESLLLNILPASTAERSRSQPQTIADQFGSASVLFADVVDFTPRAETRPPAEVVGLLDRLFSHFDTLAERHGIEKIKTIGDCYMVAAGVPTPRPDHARVLALQALDMVAATQSSRRAEPADRV